MGVLPNLLPGQKKTGAGLGGAQMMKAAAQGRMKAMYLVGVDPVGGPDPDAAGAALSKVGFLVVQDLFLTATARLAHVVLPGASFAEKDGTVTNLERRVQRLAAAVPCRGKARPDWEIIAAVATSLGAGWDYPGASDVLAEIAKTVPQYRGMSYESLGLDGRQWSHSGIQEWAEARNGHERRLWYQPRQREAEPQVTGA